MYTGQADSARRQGTYVHVLSASQNLEVVEDYLQAEVAKGNILGPFMPGSFHSLQINRFGVIPKRHQPGKWRLLTVLSYPEGRSVNDAIDKTACSMASLGFSGERVPHYKIDITKTFQKYLGPAMSWVYQPLKKNEKKTKGPKHYPDVLGYQNRCGATGAETATREAGAIGQAHRHASRYPPAFVIFRFTFEQIPFDIQNWSIFTSF